MDPLPAMSVRSTDPKRTKSSKRTPAQPDEPESKPAFTLLATVKGERGFSAVIRTGESDVRIVEVGDLLEGGFRVVMLESWRAVLSDGRETIVAKRPQS
jgi:hypothetical protein